MYLIAFLKQFSKVTRTRIPVYVADKIRFQVESVLTLVIFMIRILPRLNYALNLA